MAVAKFSEQFPQLRQKYGVAQYSAGRLIAKLALFDPNPDAFGGFQDICRHSGNTAILQVGGLLHARSAAFCFHNVCTVVRLNVVLLAKASRTALIRAAT